MVVELLAERLGSRWVKGGSGEEARATIEGKEAILLKPHTFMNLSGKAVSRAVRRWRVSLERLAVVRDDIDLPLGRIRLKQGSSSGGHRGVESVISALGSQAFLQVKIGVGRPPQGEDPAAYVLRAPEEGEREKIQEAVERAAEACLVWVREGLEAARRKASSP
jgi:PTH1 family peptidyl-tRNA hydrolase